VEAQKAEKFLQICLEGGRSKKYQHFTGGPRQLPSRIPFILLFKIERTINTRSSSTVVSLKQGD
jgi:hypothetical protein